MPKYFVDVYAQLKGIRVPVEAEDEDEARDKIWEIVEGLVRSHKQIMVDDLDTQFYRDTENG